MGAGEPVLPPICTIKRESFQNRLLDVYAAYNLMKYYQGIIETADATAKGKPEPKLDQAMNFDKDTMTRMRKRLVRTGVEGPDFELYKYLDDFVNTYNEIDDQRGLDEYAADQQRRALLHGVINMCYDVLLAYSSNLHDLCESTSGFDASFGVEEEYTPLPPIQRDADGKPIQQE